MTLPTIYDADGAAQALGVRRPAILRLSQKHPHLFRKAGRTLLITEADLALLWDEIAQHRRVLPTYEEIRPKPRYIASKERAPVVYVVGFGHYVKIGMTGFFKDRLEKIQTHAPEQIEVFATFSGGRELELQLHERFAELRLRGEWFRRVLKLDRWIKRGCPL